MGKNKKNMDKPKRLKKYVPTVRKVKFNPAEIEAIEEILSLFNKLKGALISK